MLADRFLGSMGAFCVLTTLGEMESRRKLEDSLKAYKALPQNLI